MFDFHMHSGVSFDSKESAEKMVEAAVKAGMKEICFTDHLDYEEVSTGIKVWFDTEDYNAAYDHLHHTGIKLRKGFEFGMLPGNQETFRKDLERRHFDFIIGSIHFVDGVDIFYKEYWENKTPEAAETAYFERILECVKKHDSYDVLGHLTYIGKVINNPGMRAIAEKEYRDLTDEIFRVLIEKGKGIEVNTSGKDRCGAFLPDEAYLRRFKELGGQIVTVGSDAHTFDRVGQYCHEACALVNEIFGHVCTFEDRKPIFHRL